MVFLKDRGAVQTERDYFVGKHSLRLFISECLEDFSLEEISVSYAKIVHITSYSSLLRSSCVLSGVDILLCP